MFKPKIFRNVRSNVLAGALAQSEDKWQADGVIVDGTGGYGSGVIDAGSTMGRSWFDCQFAGSPFNPKFANKRAEILYSFAEWIKKGGALPYMPELIREMTAITYSFQGDKMLMIPKALLKKNLGISTDLTDAGAVTFAYPIQPKLRLPPGVIQGGASGEYDPVARAESLMKQSGNRGDYNPLER